MKDTITRTININAPIERVWIALTDYREFGRWFQVSLDSPFAVNEITKGTLEYPGYEGLPFWVKTTKLSRPNHFAYRWPFDEKASPQSADDPTVTTLVEFMLEQQDTSTQLTIRESGFMGLPKLAGAKAFRDNQGGWDEQSKSVKEYVESA